MNKLHVFYIKLYKFMLNSAKDPLNFTLSSLNSPISKTTLNCNLHAGNKKRGMGLASIIENHYIFVDSPKLVYYPKINK